jgi:hypothetical protein
MSATEQVEFVPGTYVPKDEVLTHLDPETIYDIVGRAMDRMLEGRFNYGDDPSSALLKEHGQAIVRQGYGGFTHMDGSI